MRTYKAYLIDLINPGWDEKDRMELTAEDGEKWEDAAKRFMSGYREKGDPAPKIRVEHPKNKNVIIKLCYVHEDGFAIATVFKKTKN